jgi:hypothetical protein
VGSNPPQARRLLKGKRSTIAETPTKDSLLDGLLGACTEDKLEDKRSFGRRKKVFIPTSTVAQAPGECGA